MTQSRNLPEYPNSIGRHLAFASSAVNALSTELLREHGLRPLQWVALSALYQQDGMTVSALADYTRSSVSATSRLLGRMEERGLVIRKAVDGNRRALRVCLTDKAKKINKLRDFHKKVNDLVLADLSAAEREALLSCLERISLSASRAVDRLRARSIG